MPDPTIHDRHQRPGTALAIVGVDVVCCRCTGGLTMTMPAQKTTMDDLEALVHRHFTLTPAGWMCNKCAAATYSIPTTAITMPMHDIPCCDVHQYMLEHAEDTDDQQPKTIERTAQP